MDDIYRHTPVRKQVLWKTLHIHDFLWVFILLFCVSSFAAAPLVRPAEAKPAESVEATSIYSTEAEALKAAAGQVEHLLVVRGAMVGAWFEMAEEAVESGGEAPSFGSILSGGHLTASVQNKWIPSGFPLSNTFFSVSGGGILVTYVPSDEEKTLVPYARSLFPLLGGGDDTLTLLVPKPYLPSLPGNLVFVNEPNIMADEGSIRWSYWEGGDGIVETGTTRIHSLENDEHSGISLRSNALSGGLSVGADGFLSVTGKTTFSNMEIDGDVVNGSFPVYWNVTRPVLKVDARDMETENLVAKGTTKFLKEEDEGFFGAVRFTNRLVAKSNTVEIGSGGRITRKNLSDEVGLIVDSTLNPSSYGKMGFDPSGNMKVKKLDVTGNIFFKGVPLVEGADGSFENPWDVWVTNAKTIHEPEGAMSFVSYAPKKTTNDKGEILLWIYMETPLSSPVELNASGEKKEDKNFTNGTFTGRHLIQLAGEKTDDDVLARRSDILSEKSRTDASARYVAAILDVGTERKTVHFSFDGSADARLVPGDDFASLASRIAVAGGNGKGWKWPGAGGPSYVSLKEVPEGLPEWKSLLKYSTEKNVALSKTPEHFSGTVFSPEFVVEKERIASGKATAAVWSEIKLESASPVEWLRFIRRDDVAISVRKIPEI